MIDKVHPAIDPLHFWYEKPGINVDGYHIKGERSAIIDTGPPQADDSAVFAAFKARNIDPFDVDMILLTHGHHDHIGGSRVLKQPGRTQLIMHNDDALFLEDPQQAFNALIVPVLKASGLSRHLKQSKSNFLSEYSPTVTVDGYVEDLERLDLGKGVELTVVHLPGHTAGSVGYYWEKEGILISGDAIPCLNGNGGILPLISDLEAYQYSILRLLQMPISCMLQCHPFPGILSGPKRIRKGDEVKVFLLDALEVARHLTSAIQRHRSDTDTPLVQVCERIIAQLPESFGFKTLGSTTPALIQHADIVPCHVFCHLREQMGAQKEDRNEFQR